MVRDSASPTSSTSSPTLTTPRSILPVATVPHLINDDFLDTKDEEVSPSVTQVFDSEKFNCYIPYTPAKIDALEKIMKESREQMGANMVTTSISGIRSMLRALKKGEVVVMASDQVPNKRSGLICDFFGNEALTVSLISRLSKRTESSCHLVYCVRQKSGSGFKIVFEKKLDSMNKLDEKEGSNLMNRELEKCIIKFPEQYAWEYKRFKHSTFKSPY